MSLITTLNNAATALQVFSRAIDVEGANVANAATPGYAAVRTSIQPIGPNGSVQSSDYITLSSAGDLRADARVQAAASDAAWSQTRSDALAPLNQILDITGSTGLLQAFQQFSTAFADLAVTPNDQSLRSAALGAAGAVAVEFRRAASSVDSQQTQIDTSIGGVVGEVNRLSSSIRDYNIQLRGRDQVDPGLEAGRRTALDSLASLVDITVTAAADGTVSVLAGGQQPLVLGDQAYTLSVNPAAPLSGQVQSSGGGSSPGSYSGKLGALLDVRNNVISHLTGGSGGPGSLNELAKGFASRVNGLLTSGVTSTGVSGSPLFTYDSADDTNVARTLALDPAIQPGQLALSTSGASPRANGVANSLAALFNSSNAADQINGVSAQGLYASVAAGIGQDLATARTQASEGQNTLTAADTARQQVSGISLDREAIAITSLQRYFEASAKMVSVLDTLTTTEIGLIR